MSSRARMTSGATGATGTAAHRWPDAIVAAVAGALPGVASAEELVPALDEATALAVRERIAEILAAAPRLTEHVGAALAAASPTGEAAWLVQIALFTVGYVVVAALAAHGAQSWMRGHFVHLFDPEPRDRAEKIGYLLLRATMQLLSLALFVVVALLLALAVDRGGNEAGRATTIAIVAVVAAIWAVRVVSLNLLAPDTPSHRLAPLDDARAASLHRGIVLVMGLLLALVGTYRWLQRLGLDPTAYKLFAIAGSLVGALALCALAVRQRQAVGAMLLGASGGSGKGGGRRLLAATWHVPAVAYFLGAWSVSATRMLLDLPSASGLIGRPVLIAIGAVAVQGVCVLLIDKVAARKAGGGAGPGLAVDAPAEAPGSPEPAPPAPPARTLKGLAEHAVALIVWVGALALVLSFWGLDVTSDSSVLVRAFDVIVVVFLGYLAYQAIRITIDQRIAEEGVGDAPAPGDDPEAGAPMSRMATLLPLFRNFLLITVVAIVAMIALAQLGVNIGPLFAGAGVVGLAVGFGAQTLIRDIFSGAFFLVDDAFRVGEYIDVGGTKGTVEKISIRSMQVRHHLGALHTIPFGEIQQLTNHSRDWAMMKLELRVTYDTDVERVRKLIKKLGQELLADPELGEMFLQPLKSQGVRSMEDSAMILRVKFMTRPGDQFILRKVVYARIRELFEREGIRFAHRHVTVRVAGDGEGERALTGAQAARIAGAAALGTAVGPEEGEALDAASGDER